METKQNILELKFLHGHFSAEVLHWKFDAKMSAAKFLSEHSTMNFWELSYVDVYIISLFNFFFHDFFYHILILFAIVYTSVFNTKGVKISHSIIYKYSHLS